MLQAAPSGNSGGFEKFTVVADGENLKELHQSNFLMVRYIKANSTGMKRTALAEKKLKSNGYYPRKKGPAGSHYVVCVRSDAAAIKLGMLRVVDESGEDYLYPEDHFVAIKLTPSVERALRSAS